MRNNQFVVLVALTVALERIPNGFYSACHLSCRSHG